jgi:hypothetical protein
MYLITPALTVMFFGGSQNVAMLPQQMMMSGWTMAQLAGKKFNQVRSKIPTSASTKPTPSDPTGLNSSNNLPKV